MKQMMKLGLTLAIYATVSCFLLALVNNFTAPLIAQHQADKTQAAMKVVFPDADSYKEITDFQEPQGTVNIDNMYLAEKNGNTVGIITKADGPTYDRSTVLVGQDLNGTITGVEILETSDSAGFGQNSKDPNYKVASGKTFYGQFTGKKISDGFVVGKTFDAISSATITSKGIGNILKTSTSTASDYLSEHK